MTEPTMLDRASCPPWKIRVLADLIDTEGLCVLPGTHDAVVSTTGGLVRLDVPSGEATSLSCSARDQFGEPIRSRALAGMDDHTFALVDTKRVRILEIRGDEAVEIASVPLANDKALAMALSISASADGQFVVASATSVIQRLDRDGTSVHVPFDADFSNGIDRVLVGPDDLNLFVGRGDGRIERRDPATMELRQTIEGLSTTVLSMAVSPDSQALVAGADRVEARRYDLRQATSTPLEPSGKLTGLAWFSDGSGYVATGLSRAVAVYDREKSEPRQDMYPRQFDRNYFQASALVDDRHLVLLAEQAGVAIVDLNRGE